MASKDHHLPSVRR
ncbi:hypothetical protein LINPERHAP2_LOCUS13130 [Linum perenne]